MQQHRQTTLKNKVLFSMILLVIFQVIAIPGMLLFIHTPEQLDASSIQTLSNITDYRKQMFETEMVQWSDLKTWIEEASAIMQKFEETSDTPAHEQLSDRSFRLRLLDALSDTVLINLRRQLTTGAFVILSDGADTSGLDAIHLRDLNPNAESDSNHDILVETGLDKTGFSKGYTLDIYWSKQLTLSDNRDFFDKPMQAARENPGMEASNLGYWSNMFRMKPNDIQVITYTVPLLDSAGVPCGVIGIEISIDYLQNFLNGDEISIDENGSYYLGKLRSGNSSSHAVYETVYADSSYYRNFLEAKTLIQLEPSGTDGTQQLTVNDKPSSAVCHSAALHLYNSNTPFSSEEWILCGIVDKEQLYKSSHRFMLALSIALAFSFAIAILCSLLTTSLMFRPLRNMIHELKNSSGRALPLSRTNIAEIDNLASEISQLRERAYKSGSKVADIIETFNIPIGIYELNHTFPDKVFCSRNFFALTELPMNGWQDNYMDRERFDQILDSFHKKCTLRTDNDRQIYIYTTGNGQLRYLELKNFITDEEGAYVFMDITSQIMETEKIKHERDYDILTNLYNRRAFARIVTDLISSRKITSGVLSMWDLDNLKFFNDTYGHDTGDKYICMLAEEFHNLDYPNTVCARFAGDEFMIFLYNGDVDEMCGILEKLHASFIQRRITLPDGESITVSASAGISVYKEDSDDYENLARFADFAMYEIKHREKGGIKRFNLENYEKEYILVKGVIELNKILEDERVQFAFQPIVDIQDKKIFAYEALLRPVSQILYNPWLLLQVAEKQSKLGSIEKITWFHAVSSFFAQQKTDDAPAKLFFNSISGQCLSDREFEQLEQLYPEYLPYLVMEITEDSKPDEETEHKKRSFCAKNHMEIALDDYGTGYSTNAILMNNSFGYVKIDISLIQNIHLSSEKQDFVKGIISFCHQCHTKVIAEGVETSEEYAIVKALGANYVQGYYLAHPERVISDIRIDYSKL